MFPNTPGGRFALIPSPSGSSAGLHIRFRISSSVFRSLRSGLPPRSGVPVRSGSSPRAGPSLRPAFSIKSNGLGPPSIGCCLSGCPCLFVLSLRARIAPRPCLFLSLGPRPSLWFGLRPRSCLSSPPVPSPRLGFSPWPSPRPGFSPWPDSPASGGPGSGSSWLLTQSATRNNTETANQARMIPPETWRSTIGYPMKSWNISKVFISRSVQCLSIFAYHLPDLHESDHDYKQPASSTRHSENNNIQGHKSKNGQHITGPTGLENVKISNKSIYRLLIKPIWSKWTNDHAFAQLQVWTIP